MTRRFQLALATLCLLLGILPCTVEGGGKNRNFRNRHGLAYFDVWWREQRADRKTALMLHFGAPKPHPWLAPGDAKLADEEPQDDDLFGGEELGGLDDLGGGGLGGLGTAVVEQEGKAIAQRHGRLLDAKAPAGKVFDYSPNLSEARLPDSVRKTPEGRFGKGLEFSGKTGLSIYLGAKGERFVLDGWFKPTKRPEAPVWLMGTEHGARVWLLPDGKVRFDWFAHPHDEERQRLTSSRPVPLGEWSHLSCGVWASNERYANPEYRIYVNARVAARHKTGERHEHDIGPLVSEKVTFHLGADPEGGGAYTGLMDDVRVTCLRRYNIRERWPDFDPREHPRPISFGPPLFQEDRRVFHADFESPTLRVHPEDHDRITWELGNYADFSDYQVDAPFGKGLLVDPAMGFPRIPIQGMSPHKGTLEIWFQPMNWDNNTIIGENTPKSHAMLRFRGRDKRNGRIVTFMSFMLPNTSMFGGKGWCQPGTWSHFVWSWSPKDVVKTENNWGDIKKGDPISAFRGIRFGEEIWRAMLRRDVNVLNHVEPLYAEIGIAANFKGYHGQRPAILVDELIYHSEPLPQEQRKQTTAKWAEQHHPEKQ